ncbi:MAG: FtsX-like permease family protein [Cyclobacteriaceae bacterium]
MIRNYLTVSLRNLLQNKFFLFVNVFGLAVALSTCIVAYLNLEFALGYDEYHEHRENIYKVQIRKEASGRFADYGINPIPLGPAALNDISAIKQMTRYTCPDFTVQYGDVVLNQEIGFADEAFLDMFTYPLKLGDKESFKDKKNILLSTEMAEVYFGEENPLGELITVRNSDDKEFIFKVAGVFEKVPLNSSIYFDAFTLYDNYFDITERDRNNWGGFTGATFFSINTTEEAKTVEDLLANYIEIQNKARDDWKVAQYYMMPFKDFPLNSQELMANWLNAGMNPAAYIAPPIMAGLILLIACFNFTNTSIAISSKRLKEIGIRKVMGGGKRQLIIQFMSENLIVCAMAIVLAVAISNYLVPAYGALWPNMELSLDFSTNLGIYGFLFGLLALTAIIAGAYPSVYVSSFEPVRILRGTLKVGGTSRFSKVLLTLQYLFTVMALFAAIAFLQNANYQESLDMGFNRESVIGAQIDNHSDYLKLKQALESNADFEAVVGTSEHIGRWDYSRTLENGSKEIESFMLDFGPGYIEAMDLEMIAGRAFKEELKQSDQQNSLIVNETVVEEFGWDEPIGQRVSIDDSTTLTVVGVVKDFNHNGLWREVGPYGIRLSKEADFNFVIAKVNPSKLFTAFEFLEETWVQEIPNRPFTGFYQDQLGAIRQAKLVNQNIVVVFGFLAVLSVVLSGIGLYTLVSLSIIRRVKEIGVRKVLGAPIAQIISLLNKPFAIMIIIGGTLGLGCGYVVTDLLISTIFAYYKPVGVDTFLIPLGLILLISWSTSTFRILSAARQNPVVSLRYE